MPPPPAPPAAEASPGEASGPEVVPPLPPVSTALPPVLDAASGALDPPVAPPVAPPEPPVTPPVPSGSSASGAAPLPGGELLQALRDRTAAHVTSGGNLIIRCWRETLASVGWNRFRRNAA